MRPLDAERNRPRVASAVRPRVRAGSRRVQPVDLALGNGGESTAAARPRLFLALVLLAAAMPYRLSTAVPVIHSVSIFDILLMLAAITLLLDLAFRPIDLGYRPLFGLLCVPLFVAILSVAWSQDATATLRSVIIYAEGLIAYLFVVRELGDLSTDRVIKVIRRYAYLLIIPGVLLLLHVPGFSPQDSGLSQSSGDYISYYTRLSHPILGRSNNLATVLALLAPVLLYWGNLTRDRRTVVAAFVTLAAIFLTQSRGVLLAFVIAGLLYVPFAAYRRSATGTGLGSKIAAAVAIGVVAFAILYTFDPATQEYSAGRLTLANVTERSALASKSLGQIASHPLFGYGAGVNPGQKAVIGENTLANEDVHDTYLQQILYFGIPLGVIVSLSLWAMVAFFLGRRANPLAGVIAYTLMVQLVLFLFESSFEGTVLRVLFYLGIGLAAGLARSADSGSPPVLRANLRAAS
jgi:hypothetical protein